MWIYPKVTSVTQELLISYIHCWQLLAVFSAHFSHVKRRINTFRVDNISSFLNIKTLLLAKQLYYKMKM